MVEMTIKDIQGHQKLLFVTPCHFKITSDSNCEILTILEIWEVNETGTACHRMSFSDSL